MCNYQPKIKILSAILMTAALSACGGSSDKRANIDLGGSSSSTTSSSSSSSSSTSSVPGTSWLPLIETFDADSAQEFFSQEYQSLENVDPRDTGDTWPAFYFPTSGLPENRLIVRDNKITFGNARFSIGQGYYHDAEYDETNVFNNRKNQSTEGANVTWGELDLSKNYKVSFCVVANNDTGRFELYVDNNSSNADRSIWGSPSRLVSLGTANLTAGQRFQINVPGSVTNSASIAARIGGATSFLQFRADSTAQVTISDLWIGYQDDTATEPTACAAGDHLTLSPPSTAPNAPSITAGDSQLGITWSAVAGATGYDVSWNTTNTPPTETSQIQNASGLAHTITNLTNDTLYYVFVRAKNSSGASGWSQATEGTPVAAVVVPDAPVGLTSTAGNTQVDISWTVDTAAAAYQVAYSTTATPPASESADWVSPSGEGSHTFSGLTNDLEYHFFVRAENSAGYSELASVTATPEDLSGAGSNREWLFDADSYSNYTDEADFLAATSGNRNVNQANPAKSVNGLTFFKTDTGGSVRFRDNGIVNFNGSSFTSNARLINADSEGKLDQPLRNYVGVFVTPGEAVTVSFTWRQTTGSVNPSKVGLIDDENTLLANENAIDGANGVITISLPASHTSSEVRFFYSRENNTSGNDAAATGGIDLTAINRQYD